MNMGSKITKGKRICLKCEKDTPDTPCPYCGGSVFSVGQPTQPKGLWETRFDKLRVWEKLDETIKK